MRRAVARLILLSSALLAGVGCRPTAAAAIADHSGQVAAAAFAWHLPRGIPVPVVPKDNPMSVAKVALGRRLFYDSRLSGNRTYSCATCHQQALAFTDGRARAVGATGGAHAHSAMSLANVAYNVTYGWNDPNVRTLEAQMAVPMFNEHPIELGLRGREREIEARFAGDPRDRAAFVAAFPGEAGPVTFGNIVKAIASFERTIVSGDSPVDRYLYRDDKTALSPAAVRGMTLFFSKRLRCSECHSGFNLSGPAVFEGSDAPAPLFHNTGLYDVDGRGGYPADDIGLAAVSGKRADIGKFRTPTLRNVAVTAPYMHDGSVPTLEAVIAHYSSGGHASRLRSDRIRGFPMSEEETSDLLAFLRSLTDMTFLTQPDLGPPIDVR